MNEFNQTKPAPFAISSMSYKPAPITWGSRIHYHDFLETAVVLNGNGFFTTHDHTISVQKGDILLSPPGQYHCLYPASQDLEYCTATLLPGSGFLLKERKRPTASLTPELTLPNWCSWRGWFFRFTKKRRFRAEIPAIPAPPPWSI